MVSEVECVHADECPGCALIDRPYAEQLRLKSERLKHALRRYPLLSGVEIEPALGTDATSGYRRRAKLAVGPGGRIGAYEPRTHRVIDIPECRVVTAPIARSLAALRALLRNPPAAARPALSALTAVDLRSVDERVLVTLVFDREAAPSEAAERAAGEAILEASPEVAGVAASLGQARGPQLLGKEPHTIAGVSELVEHGAGADVLALPGAFVQVHAGQSERIVQRIATGFAQPLGTLDGATILDLYGGSGAIGLALAARGATVTLVESYRPAADAARRAGAARVVSEDVARFVRSAQAGAWDAIVINPPRRGLTPEVRAGIARLLPKIVAYVSCNPETLARDLADLRRLGLLARSAQPIDMIPLTEEVETLALLVQGAIALPQLIFEDAELLVVDKPPHEPTIPQGEHGSSLLERVRALPGAERAAPLHRLDVGTSGVCIFGKTPEAVAKWSRSWPEARKLYRALARGITSKKGVVNRALVEQQQKRPARTRYRRIGVVAGQSLLEVMPEQGKKHQIRRHLAGLGHPIVGDERHGHMPTNRHFASTYGLDRPFLHCARIEIESDAGQRRVFEAALAPDLAAVLDAASCRAWGAQTTWTSERAAEGRERAEDT